MDCIYSRLTHPIHVYELLSKRVPVSRPSLQNLHLVLVSASLCVWSFRVVWKKGPEGGSVLAVCGTFGAT